MSRYWRPRKPPRCGALLAVSQSNASADAHRDAASTSYNLEVVILIIFCVT